MTLSAKLRVFRNEGMSDWVNENSAAQVDEKVGWTDNMQR